MTNEVYWQGITKTLYDSGENQICQIDPSFKVVLDMDRDVNSKLWLSLTSVIIPESKVSMIPFTLSVTIGGVTKNYSSTSASKSTRGTDTVLTFGNSTFAQIGQSFSINHQGKPFDITVTVKPKASSGFETVSENYHACGTVRSRTEKVGSAEIQPGVPETFTYTPALRCGEIVVDEETCEFVSDAAIHVGDNRFHPYVGKYTELIDATAPVPSAQFIVSGPNDSGDEYAEYTAGSWFLTDDFYSGIGHILEKVVYGIQIYAFGAWEQLIYRGGGSVPTSTYTPEVEAADFTLSGTPSIQSTSGATAYVANISEVTLTLTGGLFPYGGSFASLAIYSDGYWISGEGRSGTVIINRQSTSSSASLSNAEVRVRVYETHGAYTEVRVNVPLFNYSPPKATKFTVHRCKPKTSGSQSASDIVDSLTGERYEADDMGAYCAIQLITSFQSFAIQSFIPTSDNTGTVSVTANNSIQPTPQTTIPQTYSYTVTGATNLLSYEYWRVLGADTEDSFDVDVYLSDRYYFGTSEDQELNKGRYRIQVRKRVSTAGVLMDFKNGGKGLGIGQVATADNTMVVAPTWYVRATNITIANYVPFSPSETKPVARDISLTSWIRAVEQRLSNLPST